MKIENIEFLPQCKDILTVKECAEVLQVCEKTVRTLIHQGEIEGFRLRDGSGFRIPKAILENYIYRHMNGGNKRYA